MRGLALLAKMTACKEEVATKRKNSPMMPVSVPGLPKMTFLKMPRCYYRAPLMVTMFVCLLMGRLVAGRHTPSKALRTTRELSLEPSKSFIQ